ncbi:uncharacterized protein LOC113214138, partial [Frankliniella occidentalis]|uniref:Inositol-pentakisphosphate 2-kinase n=1 Tax=Frankliniella occidentalis TaxID=133901 RepID=A0A9C6XCQ7_FRAOC
MHSTPGSDLVERFTCLLVQALTMQVGHECEGSTNSSWLYNGAPLFDTRKSVHHDNLKEEFPRTNQKPCNFEKQNLPEGCILHRLAQAQALDQYGVNLVFNMLMSDEDLVRATENASATYDTQYVHSIIKRGCSYELNPIESYLISATVRDCSVLICLQELKENSFEAQILPAVEDVPSKTKYILKITAVDLDPKPLSCIKTHMQRNELVQDACRGT